jgi:hypothetical protein
VGTGDAVPEPRLTNLTAKSSGARLGEPPQSLEQEASVLSPLGASRSALGVDPKKLGDDIDGLRAPQRDAAKDVVNALVQAAVRMLGGQKEHGDE